jgi:integrase
VRRGNRSRALDLDAPGRSLEKQAATCNPISWLAKKIITARLPIVRSGPLFTAETGTVLTAAHIGHYLLARRDKLPIDKFTTHDLRRTVATQLTEMAISLEFVAAVIGHEAGGRETRTLTRHYVTDLLDRKRTVLEAWDRRLSEIIESKLVSGNVAYLTGTRAA